MLQSAITGFFIFIALPCNAMKVWDPWNFVQNNTSAIAAVKTEITSANALVQQIQTTINLAKSLTSVEGLANLAGLQEEAALYGQLKNTNTELYGLMNQSSQLFQNVQAQVGASGMSWENFLNSRSSIEAQQKKVISSQYSTITNSMEKVAARRQTIVNQLQASNGQTSALQAVGAAIDVLIGQNQQLLGLLSTQGQLDIAKKERENASAEAGYIQMSKYQKMLQDENAKYK